MRIECVVLEDHGNVAVFRSNIIDDLAINRDGAVRVLFQSREQAQGSSFATTRRPDQHQQLLVLDREGKIVHGVDQLASWSGENLGQFLDDNPRHKSIFERHKVESRVRRQWTPVPFSPAAYYSAARIRVKVFAVFSAFIEGMVA